ncbi:MAG: nucleotide-binding protein [Candidatus Bathyarchaeota archaeon]|nr:nucleotide-binding protein [Candidatus Bathyarchaeum sp.]
MAPSKEATLKIILDANFFFVPSQFNLDIFEELANLLNRRFEPVLLSSTQKELEGLAHSSPKVNKQALLALRFAEKCSFVSAEKVLTESYDDVIVRVASEWSCPVATNDKELRKRLREKGVPVIFLRQKRRLEMDGAV